MVCNITDALLFSFPFPPSPSSIEWFHCYKHVLHLGCIWSACFCVYVSLWLYLPHMRENMRLLWFWSRQTSLNVMSCSCIHLPSNTIPCGWVILCCVYVPHFLDPFMSCRALGCFQGLAIVNSAAMNFSTDVSTVSCLTFFWVDAQEWYHWIIGQF
jgi:hypothetical protein